MGETGETSGMSLEFTFGCGREVNALKARCGFAEAYIIVDRSGAGNEVVVRSCIVEQTFEGLGDEFELHLMRSDGISHRMEPTEEQVASLFCFGAPLTSETTTLVFAEGEARHRVVASRSRTFEVGEQDSVLQIMNVMLNESHLNFPGGEREEEEDAQTREFEFYSDRAGRTNGLVVRGLGGDLAFFVEDVGNGEEKIVRACVYGREDDAEIEDGCFLLRSDGEGMAIEAPDELIDSLLEAGLEEISETTKIMAGGEVGIIYSQTYAVTDQKSVIDVLGSLVKNSTLKLPLKNFAVPIEKSLKEEGEFDLKECSDGNPQTHNATKGLKMVEIVPK